MNDAQKNLFLKKFQVICKCNHVTYGTIAAEIQRGTVDVEALARKLKVTRGDCKGERCGDEIREMLEELVKGR